MKFGIPSLKELKGPNLYSTLERVSVLMLLVGTLVLSLGIGLTSFATQGVFAAMSMAGGFIVFIFSMLLVIVWFLKE